MSRPKIVTSKTRHLLSGEVVTADGQAPAFVIGQKWPSDMRGAEIGSAKIAASSYSGLTGIVVTLQDSDDGATWDDWVAFTNITANGSEILDLDEERSPRRFIRADNNVTGTGTVTLDLDLNYRQVGPRGEFADGVRDVQ